MKSKVLLAALALPLVYAPEASAGLELRKDWYANRAKSNMEIGNYKAAIEAYSKVLEEEPNNLEAMRSLGIAYENQGLRDEAVAQYDRYLDKNPSDADIAFRQADVLGWSRYSYRRKDAIKYYQMGLKQKNDPKRRLKYAQLLASNQETNREAIEQYKIVLKSNQRNGEAHRGLAKAYAWNGQQDLALYHSELAKEYGSSSTDLRKLDHDLNKGREPMAGGKFVFTTQPGGSYDLNGIELSAVGRTELSPFITGRAQLGLENHWHTGNESSSGALLSFGGQYRLDETNSLNLDLGYHTLGPITASATNGRNPTTSSGNGASNFVMKAEFQHHEGDFTFAPGFERSLRHDSFLSLAGSKISGTGLGAARSNQFYADLLWEEERLNYGLKPFAGWVSALSVNPNMMFGIDGNLKYRLLEEGNFTLAAGDFMEVSHYGEDQSALSGANAAGYFSPQFYVNQTPNLSAKLSLSSTSEAELTAGPSLQFVRDNSLDGKWQLGASAGAGFSSRFAQRLQWHAGASYSKVADKFNQVQIDSSLNYVF